MPVPFEHPDRVEPLPRLQVMRIILLALCMGVLTFLGITLYLRLVGAMESAPPFPLVSYVILLVAPVSTLTSILQGG